MKQQQVKLSETEWELIEALRSFRKSKHNPSINIEIYIDSLVDRLKETDD